MSPGGGRVVVVGGLRLVVATNDLLVRWVRHVLSLACDERQPCERRSRW
jgi:hypothetical protein